MGRPRKTDMTRDRNGRIIRPWMTTSCPSCGGPKSPKGRQCYQCALPLRKRGRKLTPRCACGAPKSYYAIQCMACDKRRRRENQRHLCEECGGTFFRKAESRPTRTYRTNIYCSKRCHLIVQGRTRRALRDAVRALRQQARAELLAITQAQIRAAHREQVERVPLPCPECGTPVISSGLGRPPRFCSRACCSRAHAKLRRYRERSGIPEMRIGDDLYRARRALGLASLALQQTGKHQKFTGGRS